MKRAEDGCMERSQEGSLLDTSTPSDQKKACALTRFPRMHAQQLNRMDTVDLQVIACGQGQTEICETGGLYGRGRPSGDSWQSNASPPK